MPTLLTDPGMLVVLGLVAAGTMIVGVLVGFVLGRRGHGQLRHELDLKEATLKTQAHLDREREEALAIATERLSAVFGQLANQQLQSHSETFRSSLARVWAATTSAPRAS